MHVPERIVVRAQTPMRQVHSRVKLDVQLLATVDQRVQVLGRRAHFEDGSRVRMVKQKLLDDGGRH